MMTGPITHESALEHFHEQIGFVLKNYKPHGLKVSSYHNIVIGGLGGSGIGGKITRLAFFTSSPVPIEALSEYTLPAYAGRNTLVVLCSYSGNTEETLSMLDVALERGCQVVALTSGGHLKNICAEKSLPCYFVEPGFQPRMALGYSLATLLMVFGELLGHDMRSSLEQVESMLREPASMKAQAEGIFEKFENTIGHKFIVICDMAFEAVATRFCQQIQENAKGEAFVSVLPEANHNMIESYYGPQETNFIILNSGLNPRIARRFDFLREILTETGATVYEFPVVPFTLQRIFEVIHITDWLSIMASNAKGVNNMEVPNIARLKEFLGETKG